MATPTALNARAFSNVTDSTLFAEFDTFFNAALTSVSNRCGPVGGTTITEQVAARSGVMVLNERPVQTLTSVTDSDGNTISITGAKISRRSAIVRLVSSICDEVDVVYEAGWDPYPDDLEKTVYIITDHLWDTQRGRSGSFARIHGLDDDAPVGGDASHFVLKGFAWPRRAMELSRDYWKFGIA